VLGEARSEETVTAAGRGKKKTGGTSKRKPGQMGGRTKSLIMGGKEWTEKRGGRGKRKEEGKGLKKKKTRKKAREGRHRSMQVNYLPKKKKWEREPGKERAK